MDDQDTSRTHDTPDAPPESRDHGADQSDRHEDSHHRQYRPQHVAGAHEIINSQWLTLQPDESVKWWGHPSLIPHIPVMALSILSALFGLGLFFLTDFGFPTLILIPVGILGAVGDYLRIVTTFYVITTDKVVRKEGIIRRHTIPIRYENIEHTTVKQSIPERLFGYGDIEIATAGTQSTESRLEDVSNPRHVSQLIDRKKDKAYRAMRHPGSQQNGPRR